MDETSGKNKSCCKKFIAEIDEAGFYAYKSKRKDENDKV